MKMIDPKSMYKKTDISVNALCSVNEAIYQYDLKDHFQLKYLLSVEISQLFIDWVDMVEIMTWCHWATIHHLN